jgi:hypothetical protein
MIPVSTSRLYIFGVKLADDDKTVQSIHDFVNEKFPDISWRSIEIKRARNSNENQFRTEIHINHLRYRNRRVFSKDESSEIRIMMDRILHFVPGFEFSEIHLVNDSFDRNPSLGLSRRNIRVMFFVRFSSSLVFVNIVLDILPIQERFSRMSRFRNLFRYMILNIIGIFLWRNLKPGLTG